MFTVVLLYCKLFKVEKFAIFMDWLATTQNFSSGIILLAITSLCEIGYGYYATVNVSEQITADSYNHETFPPHTICNIQ